MKKNKFYEVCRPVKKQIQGFSAGSSSMEVFTPGTLSWLPRASKSMSCLLENEEAAAKPGKILYIQQVAWEWLSGIICHSSDAELNVWKTSS